MKERSADLDASYAKNPRLKTKNRYANVSAATHSRVVLPAVGDEEFSDYINANYIDVRIVVRHTQELPIGLIHGISHMKCQSYGVLLAFL